MPNAKTLRPVWAEIDLSNFKKNIGVVRDLIPKTSEIMAVVKANAYGIGAVPASKAALEAGASWLAVATPDEAVELREALPEANILVLGAVTSEAAEVLVNLGVSLTVTSVQGFADAENAAKRFNKKAKVHLKIDTGMGRIGFRPGAELESALDQIAESCYVELEGAFTHFAAADVDPKYTEMQSQDSKMQLSAFHEEVSDHATSTPQTLRAYWHGQNLIMTWLDPGIMLYGCYPNEALADRAPLYPVFSLKARVSHVKEVSAGTKVGYGLTYETHEDTAIATVPIGYADGYPRKLSNIGSILIKGCRYPVVGRICMDQLMVDIGRASSVTLGDIVTLIGVDGTEEITLDEVAGLVGTITHEILTGITARVPRVYLK